MSLIKTLLASAFMALLTLPALAADTTIPEQTRAIDPGHCAAVSASRYKKSLIITRFQRVQAASSNAGYLHDIDDALPQWLLEDLATQQISAPASLITPPLEDPQTNSPFELTTVTRQQAAKHRAQLIISGTISDMSMTPTSEYSGLYTRVVNGARDTFNLKSSKDKRQRLFSLYLQLRDGITGELLFDNTYRTTGIWPARRYGDIGFDSTRFRQSDYGEQVWQLLQHARDELVTAIRCQPHVAPVELREGQATLVVHSGANHGLRNGDILNLYQLSQYPITGVYQHYDVRLIRQEIPVQLVEVYPSHSIARIEQRGPLTGRFVAISP
ncbi:flagella assembly protein FlgT middle domain-containing protein [Cellvibrio polysaccharolyticus]|uniref:Flagellar assembly protein T middle domain-containing protein n=1 Tax=Cellvibrio polysaccharolyticus TaxID=2082724 RepID=A0A928V6K1_9GAMM|nr:flagella assembly protein FlgT middle domain-containing protein [Cellvibrio polysaccharolyticus]MBE8718833.1 hypothetical protein [Cellvibrio polysaccharolyticus]